ncbi:MAG: hypothetical protein A3C07_04750 [Candidatus Sungbacteria bacterium RIFCSPHIGHO2_02_FULL_47_11]|uniref:Uncharacterized protein n=1 Tax=Candidatus Sungbacteria bacterium RIFCSPHIGHO2_02_FULL_47_11 TaxID=1802270 RepID=A0A1G2KHF5_9BACT|nr:MAG: hypothetical protein A3C07_04750 [Candidatus Sungbacteria bacterium RIFCSPHIGHO2_02_FULL_47_11]
MKDAKTGIKNFMTKFLTHEVFYIVDLKKLVPLCWRLADFTPLESSTRFVWQHNILQEHLPGFLLHYCYIF